MNSYDIKANDENINTDYSFEGTLMDIYNKNYCIYQKLVNEISVTIIYNDYQPDETVVEFIRRSNNKRYYKILQNPCKLSNKQLALIVSKGDLKYGYKVVHDMIILYDKFESEYERIENKRPLNISKQGGD